MQAFELSWQPTVADYEQLFRAKRRATRVVWLERGAGALLVLGWAQGVIHADPVAIFFFLLGVSMATGVYLRTYRWLFTYRRHPSMFLLTRSTVDEQEIREIDDESDVRMAWSRWKAVLHLPDRLILMTETGGNCSMTYLPKRGLADPEQWPALVRLVESRVPDHPNDPRPRSIADDTADLSS